MAQPELSLVVGLPYYHYPAQPVAGTPLLLFLHGVGEGFVNRKRIGYENVLKQGPPKFLPLVPEDHPLRTSFTLVVPQLPERDTLWGEVVNDVKDILGEYRPQGESVYVMGFSKGGLGAFQIATDIDARALVVIDASPMNWPIDRARGAAVKVQCPYWAIHTTYAPGESLARVQVFNDSLPANMHDGLAARPSAGGKIRTILETVGDPIKKHVSVCNQVSESRSPYEWLLEH